jgi:inosose dehydratase
MELGNKFPREPAALRAALAPYGLACISGWYSAELLTRDAAEEMQAAKAHAGLLKAMGCDVMIVAETSNAIHSDRAVPLARRPELSPEQWPLFCRRMSDFAARLADGGLRLAYHYHMGTVIQSEQDIMRFVEGTSDQVQLVLDTGHATWGGADPAKLARDCRARVGHVHVKDVRSAVMEAAARDDWSFLDAVIAGVYTVPGDGMIDFASVLREIRGYVGWIVVEAEQDPARADPLLYGRMGHANLKRFMAEAGLAA